ncbi:sodium/proline symporter PutP [Kangiella koreensis]|uniref:Sodium/proline symporter n=1 Tax=Kangiella koreensis (strain DSM 16069 / JCM 12317 / KCTC 12182 / SW-125) TaxID=523791 RepID=C7RAB8_KANKD|nr:sodium/proline symporter PutP [Kangiella koreensis]ACV26237.1 sodium/proline symporter [Kangiella koreensis DSM 16069]
MNYTKFDFLGMTVGPVEIAFLIYLVFMIGIGIWAYMRTNDSSDYMLGGRGLGGAVTALSAGASDMSGWILMGLPGAIYFSGLSDSWLALFLIIGAYLNWKFIAGRLRAYTEIADNALTLPDYFAGRFHDAGKALRIVAVLVMIIFFGYYIGSGLVAGSKLFESSFGYDYNTALLISSIVIISYTFLGGFLAVSWTDFFQGLIIMTALIVAPIVLLVEYNGLSGIVDATREIKPEAVSFTQGFFDNNDSFKWIAFLSLAAWGLGYFGQPHILARFMAIKSVNTVPQARRIGMSWMIVCVLGAVFIGFAGIAYFGGDFNAKAYVLLSAEDVAVLSTKPGSEKVFLLLTQALFNPWLAGFLLAAILAAVMSTIDSQLLAVSSSVTEDVYKPYMRPNASEKELVWVNRFVVILVAGIGIAVAMGESRNVLNLVGQAWAGFGAAFGPVIILSLLWQRMTRHGALAGIVTGAVTVLVWDWLGSNTEIALFDLYEMLPGFVFATLAIIIVSKLTQVAETTYNQFDWYRNEFKKYKS